MPGSPSPDIESASTSSALSFDFSKVGTRLFQFGVASGERNPLQLDRSRFQPSAEKR
jgi:hypothetical protein